MAESASQFYKTYAHFDDEVLRSIRKETFGIDLGQNSWVTADEYDRFIEWLGITPEHHVLEVACGSGGPALYVADKAGCRVTGVDVSEDAVANASSMVSNAGASARVRFQTADANQALPFERGAFDAMICIDAMNHLPDRLAVLRDWCRLLRTGRRGLFTDPVVVTGPVTNEELAL